MAHHYTHGLSEYISSITYDSIPKAIVDRIKLLVLDSAGAGLLGAALPWSHRLRAAVSEAETPGKVSIWGTKLRFSAPSAALLNGTAVHAFEIDDVGAGGHHGSVTLTTALALAQHRGGISGKELITAIVAGVETASRVGRCVGNVPHVGLGFHGPGLMGTFAAAGTAARTLKLSTEDVVNVLGHAGQQAASLMFTHHGGMGKRMLAGQAARTGTFSAIMAANGFTNAENVFEAEYGGFVSAHTGNRGPQYYDLSQLTKDLGKEFQSAGVNFKMWACRVPTHPTLEGIKTLRKQHPIPPDQVEKVEIRLGKGSFQNVGWPFKPTTVTSAQLNLYYVSAIMLLENDVFVDQFSDEKVHSKAVADMVSRIKIMHDPALDKEEGPRTTPVEITLKGGKVLKVLGRQRDDHSEPVTRQDVEEKFRKMVKRTLTPSAQTEFIKLCDRLETVEDATVLAKMMTVDAQPPANLTE